MATPGSIKLRPNVDVESDIENVIVHYPPLMNDRHHIHYSVQDGVATLSGHVKTPITRQYLLARVAEIPGVTSTSADQLYDDESIRLDVGRFIPPGMVGTVEYGRVILAGDVPSGTNIEDVMAQISQLPGVDKVIKAYKG